MFDQDKSGLLVIQDGQFSIRDLNIAPFTKNETFDFALQSFPFLIKDAKPAIQTDSGKYARRTAVGIDADKNIYILTATTKELTLYQFMTELLHTKIPFTYVLNLDGGPSTGVQANWNGEELLENSMTGVSSILRFQKSEK